MLKNILKKIALIVLLVFSVVFIGSVTTEARSLVADDIQNAHTAVMVVEDFTNKKNVTVDDVSGITKASQAKQWYKDHAIDRNRRYISTDQELLNAWAKFIRQAGGTVTNPEVDYRKIGPEARQMLESGKTLYSFETKFIVADKSKEWQKAASIGLGIATLVRIF